MLSTKVCKYFALINFICNEMYADVRTDILNFTNEVSNQTFVELILISDSVKPKRVKQSLPIVSKQISRRL